MTVRLTAEQIAIIRRWAERNPYIQGVRIFGTRAQDPTSGKDDIDVAITIGAGRASTSDGVYTRFGDLWRKELRQLLGTNITLLTYPPREPEVKSRVDRNGVILWRSDNSNEQ